MLHHNPQINPIFKKGTKDAAVLLIHGFTGTPDCMRHQANHINSLGFTVSVPLLAGHGTTKENLAKTGWKDWYETCKTSYTELQENYSQVFVAGLSLGGILTLKLAEDFSQGITAISCLATPVFLNKWVHSLLPLVWNTPIKYLYQYQKKADPDVKDPNARKNFWHIEEMPLACIHSLVQLQKQVRHNIHKVIVPSLLIHSRYDSTAPFESMNYISKNISSKTTETVTLENSFHLITVDYEKDVVSKKIGEFFYRYLN